MTFPDLSLPLVFEHPERLIPLLAGGGVLLLLGVLLSRRSRGLVPNLLSLLLRGGAAGIVVVLLLGPAVEEVEESPGTILAALDLSRSVSPAARLAAWERIRDWRTGPRAASLMLLGFGEGVQALEAGPGGSPPGAVVAPGQLVSDPSAALAALLLSPAAAGQAARLLMMSDGALPSPGSAVPNAAALDPLVVALRAAGDAAVRATSLEPVAPPAPDEPLRLLLKGTVARDVAAEVLVFLDGARARSVPVRLAAGAVEVPLTLPPLPAGHHVVAAEFVVAGDDPLDNRVATTFTTVGRPRVAVVSAAQRPLIASALKVQGMEVVTVATETFLDRPASTDGAGVIILDRVGARALSADRVLAHLRQAVEGGAGLVYLPREERAEMFNEAEKPFLSLLPLLGREPPPPPKPEEEEPKPEPDGGLKPPDPEKRKKEEREAPSLGLLLLVDASYSMRGQRIRIAKEAAIAAADVLHPEDHVAVVTFNAPRDEKRRRYVDGSRVVLELTPARDKEFIADRISRIAVGGGTHFGWALEKAQEVMEGENLAIRHVIMISDGESQPYPLKRLVQGMAARGITVSTVGCGRDFHGDVLSDIAHWGRGKFYPAYDVGGIPQIFTIEAERVIDDTGARRRPPPRLDKPKEQARPPEPDPSARSDNASKEPETPKPPAAVPFQLGLPAPYLAGIRPHDVQGVLGFHPTVVRAGGWVSLEVETGEPMLAHGFVGYGRVAAFTVPLEGPWAVHVMAWDDYQTLLAQMVRFLYPDAGRHRFHLVAAARNRAVRVKVVDREERMLPDGLRFVVEDAAGVTPKVRQRQVSADTWRLNLDPTEPAAGLRVRVDAGAGGVGNEAFVSVEPPPEVRDGGLDLEGLESWSHALGGQVQPALPRALAVPLRRTERHDPWGEELLLWLLLLLALDFLAKRFFGGRALARPARRS